MKLFGKTICYLVFVMLLFSQAAYADKAALDEIENLKRKHNNNPKESVYISAIAKKYKQLRDFPEAIIWFEKSLSLNEDNTESLFQLGMLHSWTGEYVRAVDYLKRCLLLAPTHDDAKLSLARVYSWQGKEEEAVSLTSEVIEHNPDYLDAYTLKAKILLWKQDYAAAKDIYNSLLLKKNDFLEAHLGLMDIDAFIKNYDGAINKGISLLEQFPDSLPLHRSLGKIYSWKGDYDSAYKHLHKALVISPSDKETLDILIRVYRWAGDYQKGISLQQKILSDNPDSIEAIMETAHLYELAGDDTNAITWYEKALLLDKDNSEIQAKLGLLYSRTSRINDSIDALKKRIEVDSNDVESIITLGRAYSWSQEIGESIALYKKALKLDLKNEEAYLGLGRSYYYDGQWAKAKEAFLEVLRLDPLRKEAKEAIEKIDVLMKPHFTTSFDSFLIRNYQPDIGSYDQRVINTSFSQDIDLAFYSDFSVGIQYKKISEREDGLAGSQNYRFKGDEYAFTLKKTFLGQFSFLGKIISGSYGNDGGDVLFSMDKDMVSGFGLLKYSYDKLQLNLIYSKEVIYPIIQGNVFKVGYFRDVGISAGYSFFDDLKCFLFYYDRKYYDGRKRYDRQVKLRYTLPLYRKLELLYAYTNLTAPNEEIHEGGLLFRDRMGNLSYFLQYSLEDNSFQNVKIHEFNLFCAYAFSNSWSLNGDIIYSKEREADRDEITDVKVYAVYHF